MKTENIPLYSRDGTPLHFQWVTPENQGANPASGTVVMTHGLGEHSGRYGHVVEQFAACGYEVARYDLRGHGRSGGRRGDAAGFASLLDDLDTVVTEATRRATSGKPLFLYGHSLGGLITLRFLQSRSPSEIAGAVIASPWLRLAFEPPKWKIALANIARRICPGFRQITGMDPTRVSRDLAFIQAMPDLHLTHHQLSARLFFEILQACKASLAAAPSLAAPLLILHGQADQVTSWIASREFYETAGTPLKTLKLYPDTVHETHNDLGREQVLADIVDWLKERRNTK